MAERAAPEGAGPAGRPAPGDDARAPAGKAVGDGAHGDGAHGDGAHGDGAEGDGAEGDGAEGDGAEGDGAGGGEAAAFLARAGWSAARRAALAGDASGRRYERLTRGGGRGGGGEEGGAARSAVLMLAAPDPADAPRPGGVRAFLDVAARLTALGLSPPAILAACPERGLLLLEDLGDRLLAREAEARPRREPALYAGAAGVLARLREAGPPEGLPLFDARAMTRAAALAGPWYAQREDAPWSDALEAALEAHAGPADTLILRDFHAENLLWLPGRAGPARVGLLDFQDAMRGPAAYDLASLLRDARRDVAPGAARAARDRLARATGVHADRLDAALAVLGAQRALRILGVLGRLVRRDGRARYAALVPRVWGHLARDLAHPACAGLRRPVLDALPPPEDAALARALPLPARALPARPSPPETCPPETSLAGPSLAGSSPAGPASTGPAPTGPTP